MQHLNNLAWQEAERRNLISAINSPRTPHISVLGIGERVTPDLGAYLKANGIRVTVRGRKVRISPYVYNEDVDITILFEELATRL